MLHVINFKIMDLKFEITVSGVDNAIEDEKIVELLHNMRARLEGYSTPPPIGINLEGMEIKYKKE